MPDLALQLRNWRLTTAEILYHLPDHPGILQTFVWQQFDLVPEFPQLRKFLDFWVREIEGPLHSVKIGAVEIVTPGEMRYAAAEFRLQ